MRGGGLIAYPTDSCYALGWHLGDKDALERVRRIRQADRHHHFTLVCGDLAEVGRFARLDTWQFRMLQGLSARALYLPAAGDARDAAAPAAREAAHDRRAHARSPGAAACCSQELGEPLMSSTLMLPRGAHAADRRRARSSARLEHEIDAVLDGGDCGIEPTTVVDLSVNPPVIVRAGQGRARARSRGAALVIGACGRLSALPCGQAHRCAAKLCPTTRFMTPAPLRAAS